MYVLLRDALHLLVSCHFMSDFDIKYVFLNFYFSKCSRCFQVEIGILVLSHHCISIKIIITSQKKKKP